MNTRAFQQARQRTGIVDMDLIQPVVDAVLYEGYILYPYRPTSAKNRQRWTFGGIYPELYAMANSGAEPFHMQTQCLLEGGADTRLEVRVRFLHLLAREVGALDPPLHTWPADQAPGFRHVPSLHVGEQQFHSWQEAMEREVVITDCPLRALMHNPRSVPFAFNGRHDVQPVTDGDGLIRGMLRHTQHDIQGRVELSVEAVADTTFLLSVRVENHTRMEPARVTDREQASLYAFASTHTILGAEHGAFISLMDPPAELKEVAAACNNQGTWPVLVGVQGARNSMLSSPIILYDYPEVAPESPGDLYDSLEIDEILSLRILAMTDAEKREMAATDPRAAALLARTEALDGDDFMRLHGVMRDAQSTPAVHAPSSADHTGNAGSTQASDAQSPRLAWYREGNIALKVGDRVRLRPKAGGDIMDVVLAGMTAVIESIERDFENRVHVAVAIDDDPGREWGLQRMPGHRFFFSLDEIELLESAPPRQASA